MLEKKKNGLAFVSWCNVGTITNNNGREFIKKRDVPRCALYIHIVSFGLN